MAGRITALVLAAGQGKRMHSRIHKQFMELQGKPVLYYSLYCFQQCMAVDRILVVTGEEDIPYVKEQIIWKYHLDKVSDVIPGGRERYESVEHGLDAITDVQEEDVILIHDGARPFVTEDMILRSIAEAKKSGACTVGMPVKDTIKIVDREGNGIQTPDRKTLWQIQTPQTFRVSLIKQVHDDMLTSGDTNVTDDTMLVERYAGQAVKVIEGSYENIKITTPEDLVLAEAFLLAENE